MHAAAFRDNLRACCNRTKINPARYQDGGIIVFVPPYSQVFIDDYGTKGLKMMAEVNMNQSTMRTGICPKAAILASALHDESEGGSRPRSLRIIAS